MRRNNKWVKELIRDELDQELENKVAIIGEDAEFGVTPDIPEGDVTGSGNYLQLFPFIPQASTEIPGTSPVEYYSSAQYNRRVGNEIRLKHLDVNLLLSMRTTENGATSGHNTSLGVRVMILRQKDTNDWNSFMANSQADKLLENGAIISPGPSNFRGDTFNLFQKINREQFAVRYDHTFYLDPVYIVDGSGSNKYAMKTQKPTHIHHRLTFGKAGLKLTFSEGTSVSPTNFPYLLVIGYAATASNINPDSNRIIYSYTANASYTDA